MPIEIRELVIKVTVEETSKAGIGNAPADSRILDKDEIIEECVEKVLEILHNSKKER